MVEVWYLYMNHNISRQRKEIVARRLAGKGNSVYAETNNTTANRQA